jgi:hypothetical protein
VSCVRFSSVVCWKYYLWYKSRASNLCKCKNIEGVVKLREKVKVYTHLPVSQQIKLKFLSNWIRIMHPRKSHHLMGRWLDSRKGSRKSKDSGSLGDDHDEEDLDFSVPDMSFPSVNGEETDDSLHSSASDVFSSTLAPGTLMSPASRNAATSVRSDRRKLRQRSAPVAGFKTEKLSLASTNKLTTQQQSTLAASNSVLLSPRTANREAGAQVTTNKPTMENHMSSPVSQGRKAIIVGKSRESSFKDIRLNQPPLHMSPQKGRSDKTVKNLALSCASLAIDDLTLDSPPSKRASPKSNSSKSLKPPESYSAVSDHVAKTTNLPRSHQSDVNVQSRANASSSDFGRHQQSSLAHSVSQSTSAAPSSAPISSSVPASTQLLTRIVSARENDQNEDEKDGSHDRLPPVPLPAQISNNSRGLQSTRPAPLQGSGQSLHASTESMNFDELYEEDELESLVRPNSVHEKSAAAPVQQVNFIADQSYSNHDDITVATMEQENEMLRLAVESSLTSSYRYGTEDAIAGARHSWHASRTSEMSPSEAPVFRNRVPLPAYVDPRDAPRMSSFVHGGHQAGLGARNLYSKHESDEILPDYRGHAGDQYGNRSFSGSHASSTARSHSSATGYDGSVNTTGYDPPLSQRPSISISNVYVGDHIDSQSGVVNGSAGIGMGYTGHGSQRGWESERGNVSILSGYDDVRSMKVEEQEMLELALQRSLQESALFDQGVMPVGLIDDGSYHSRQSRHSMSSSHNLDMQYQDTMQSQNIPNRSRANSHQRNSIYSTGYTLLSGNEDYDNEDEDDALYAEQLAIRNQKSYTGQPQIPVERTVYRQGSNQSTSQASIGSNSSSAHDGRPRPTYDWERKLINNQQSTGRIGGVGGFYDDDYDDFDEQELWEQQPDGPISNVRTLGHRGSKAWPRQQRAASYTGPSYASPIYATSETGRRQSTDERWSRRPPRGRSMDSDDGSAEDLWIQHDAHEVDAAILMQPRRMNSRGISFGNQNPPHQHMPPPMQTSHSDSYTNYNPPNTEWVRQQNRDRREAGWSQQSSSAVMETNWAGQMDANETEEERLGRDEQKMLDFAVRQSMQGSSVLRDDPDDAYY